MDSNPDLSDTVELGDHYEMAANRLRAARIPFREYEVSVRRILIHLAQIADLVISRRITVSEVYDAIGHDLRSGWKDPVIRST